MLFLKFLVRACWREVGTVGRVVQSALVSIPLFASAVIGFFGGQWSRDAWPWYHWLGIAFLVAIGSVVVGIIRRAYRLEKDQETILKIESRNAPDYRFTEFNGPLIKYYCRICVRNTSKTKPVHGVVVRIVRTNDYSFDAPQTLIPKKITINPDTDCNWTVASGAHFALGENANIILTVSHNGTPFIVVGSVFCMTIEVSSDSTPPATETFLLLVNAEGQPSLVPVNEATETDRELAEEWLAELR